MAWTPSATTVPLACSLAPLRADVELEMADNSPKSIDSAGGSARLCSAFSTTASRCV
ncbi:MAG: hypothetical protein VKN56_06410 [Cyanobacteriota bacterium]|nr:hypothetical protein [Cyanobacteriota bacterium]